MRAIEGRHGNRHGKPERHNEGRAVLLASVPVLSVPGFVGQSRRIRDLRMAQVCP